ncbi:uncharacterized protein LOC141912511 isoform X2 [Tubulanus polymorphus]|uniref:uncharacterized protein LOC141912511 isoform X2 n=1 Tax=Tubulanus polymorphus TaxID=672921 RepID=UPI003DA239DA
MSYDQVVSVIDKPPSSRTTGEINALIPFFLKKSELFKSLKTDILIDIIRNCLFKRVERDFVLIKQGEKGDCFYIILSGKVAIYISNALADEGNLTGTVDDEADDERDELLGDEDFKKEEKKKPLDRSKFGNYIAPLDTGKSFGELALINKDCVRNASIIADETTDLVVVDRELYNRSLKAAQLAEFEERNTFVSECPYFSNWQQRFKKQMAMSLVKVKIPYDGCIVKQGDPVVGLYFVLRGQSKVIMDPTQHETQYPQYYPIEDFEVNAERNEELEELLNSTKKKQSLAPVQTDVIRGPPSAEVLKRRKGALEHRRKIYEICVIGPREVIGDMELSMELPTYMQTLHCMQATEVYSLDMKNFERLVSRKNPWTVEAMRNSAEVKIESRAMRFDKHIPLLNALMHKIADSHFQKEKQHMPKEDKPNYLEMISPQRGPLIDLFGPGTVFYRNRMREKARREAKRKNFGFQNPAAVSWGLKMAALSNMVNAASGANNLGDDNLSLPRLTTLVCHNDQNQATGNAFLTDVNGDREDVDDWETSDRALSQLEARIRQWHEVLEKIEPLHARPRFTYQTQHSGNNPDKKVVLMRRFQKDETMKIAPGKKVVIRKRKPNNVMFRRPVFSDGEEDENHDRSPINRYGKSSNRLAMSEGHASQPSDTEGEQTDEDRCARNFINNLKPSSAHAGTRKHNVSLRKQSSARRHKKQYSIEEYKLLKEELIQKQREFTRYLSKLGV